VTVHVVEGGPVNAFTLPGGILVFYSDLIDQAKNSSQVAGVLAHEIGHVVHHHPIKGIARQYGIDLLAKLVSGGYSDLLNTLSSGGNILLAMRNGRAFEREADATGVALLEKLNLRADGISGFFEQMLEKEPKDAASAAGIWSSHPPTQERIDATKRPPTGIPAFSAADWKALREVCK
jgi:beta-barrel assembly-enhancing protease